MKLKKIEFAFIVLSVFIGSFTVGYNVMSGWTGIEKTISDGYIEGFTANFTELYLETANIYINGENYTDDFLQSPPVDHGGLTGLLDDDHTQYLELDGSDPLTGELSAQSGIDASIVNASAFHVDGVNYTDSLLGDFSGINLLADNVDVTDTVDTVWLDLNGDKRNSWPSMSGSAGVSAVDYRISVEGAYVVGYDRFGVVIQNNTGDITTLQNIVNVDSNPKTIFIDQDFDAGTDTLEIDYSGVTIYSDGVTYLAGSTWAGPRIRCINITANSQNVLNTWIEGLNLRGVYLNTHGGTYNIGQVFMIRNNYIPRHNEPESQGIRLMGSGYAYFVYIEDCAVEDYMDCSLSDSLGFMSIESSHDGNGQWFVSELDYKQRVNNAQLLGIDGRNILFTIDRMSYVNLDAGNTGSVVVRVYDDGMLTDFKLTDSLFELHYSQDIFQIDNTDTTEDSALMAIFSGNTLSLTNGETIYFVDNNMDTYTDWISWTNNQIRGSENYIKVNWDDMNIGDPKCSSRFTVDVEFIGDDLNHDFRQNAIGGKSEIVYFGTMTSQIDDNPEYLSPMSPYSPSTSESQRRYYFPRAGTISNLNVYLGTAPGTGDSWTFTFYRNGVSQSVGVTISGTDDDEWDYTNSFEVNAGDYIVIRCDKTATPASTYVGGYWYFQEKVD